MSDELAPLPPPSRPSRRAVTREKAEALAKLLLSDPTHTIESAAVAVGLRGGTVRELLSRFHKDKSTSQEDEDIAEIIDDARTAHIHEIRKYGFVQASDKNNAGATWAKWQLEIQDPLHHPRRTETAMELTGKDGAPVQVDNTIRYVVMVPPPEPDDEGDTPDE